jgi:hypothetical protein
MHARPILAIALAVLLCVLASGCTGSPADLPPTPAATLATVPVTAPVTVPAPVPVATTERVRALPAERQVSLALSKDRPTSEIHLLYQGGPGEIVLTRVWMRVYTSETEYQEYVMSNGRKPIPGDEIVAPGTRQPDRVEVFVTSAGYRYKVMDEYVVAGMYY